MKIIDFVKRYGSVGLAQLLPVNTLVMPNANVFFVDSSNANAANQLDGEQGNSWEKPFATINYPIYADLVTANQGDVILVAPGHTETISGATGTTSILMDIAGVTIIGLVCGDLRPTLTFSATTSTLSITAANCRIKFLTLVSNIDNCAVAITAAATADGFVLEDCWFKDTAAAKEFLVGISLATGCDYCKILNNRVFGAAGGGTSWLLLVGASQGTEVSGNIVQGTWSGSAIDASGAAATQLIIDNNRIFNQAATNGVCVSAHASTTGMLTRNLLMTIASVFAAVITSCAAMGKAENYLCGEIAKSGALSPVGDS
jgi:hypothetical protein